MNTHTPDDTVLRPSRSTRYRTGRNPARGGVLLAFLFLSNFSNPYTMCAKSEAQRLRNPQPPSSPPVAVAPLTVGEGLTVLRDGRPYRAIGVNYFDCFLRFLREEEDTAFEAGFATLERYRIPFARFCATGFTPRDMRLYQDDREEYFRRLDAVVEAAEDHGVGLIPSLFWRYTCVPELVGEPASAWGDVHSKTHAWMRRYTREVVARYVNSPALWMWEMGNEYGLKVLLPPRPQPAPGEGKTVKSWDRPAHEVLRYEEMRTAFREFAREVRKLDPFRPICTGESVPRPFAWHQERENTWEQDTREQFDEVLALAHPDPINVVSVHLYQNRDLERLEWILDGARKIGKPVFVGEFGALGFDQDTRRHFQNLLNTWVHSEVALAALWVFAYDRRPEYEVTDSNERSYQLEAIMQANDQLQRGIGRAE